MTLSEERMAALVAPYLEDLPGGAVATDELYGQLGLYLDLLVKWNARTNLTAVRDPEEMVRRHFGESLFAGCRLGEHLGLDAEVLDLGSGAGFPGIPVQLLLPGVRVTLAESQGKKSSFLREVVRCLGLRCEVWAGRAEAMGEAKMFDAVMLRAVDRMPAMVEVGRTRVRRGGILLEMVGDVSGAGEVYSIPGRAGSFVRLNRI